MEQAEIKHFTVGEILHGWTVPNDLVHNIITTLKVLDIVREEYGKPIYVNSTYRDKEYNNAVGGKPKSLHLVFNAIDWTIQNKSDLIMLFDKINEMDLTHKFTFLPKAGCLGLGYYMPKYSNGALLQNAFIHIDTRGVLNRTSPARWHG